MKLTVLWRNSHLPPAKTELVQDIYAAPFKRYPADQLKQIFDSAKANTSKSNPDYSRWEDMRYEGQRALIDYSVLRPSEVRNAQFVYLFENK